MADADPIPLVPSFANALRAMGITGNELSDRLEADADFTKALRDDFARAALKGILSQMADPQWEQLHGWAKQTAELAYEYADAMLEARKKGTT